LRNVKGIGDFGKLLGGIAELGLRETSPQYRIPIELGSNMNTYPNRKIYDYPEEKTKMGALGYMPSDIAHMASSVRGVNSFRKYEKAREMGKQPVSALVAALNSEIGGIRAYSPDMANSARFVEYRIRDELRRVKGDLKRATTKGDTGEAERLATMVQDLEGDLARVHSQRTALLGGGKRGT